MDSLSLHGGGETMNPTLNFQKDSRSVIEVNTTAQINVNKRERVNNERG